MVDLGRSRILVYGAVGVALLLIGARWIRSDTGSPNSGEGSLSFESRSQDGAGGSARLAPDDDVVVHVAGEVKRPGVYRLPFGSRVTDAVERAGGATGQGSSEAINLAARLADGQQVVIPARSPTGGVATPAGGDEGPISLGSASAEDLEEIEGIGPVTAQNIIDFRDSNGGVASIDELDEISGIGPTTIDSLRDRLQP